MFFVLFFLDKCVVMKSEVIAVCVALCFLIVNFFFVLLLDVYFVKSILFFFFPVGFPFFLLCFSRVGAGESSYIWLDLNCF